MDLLLRVRGIEPCASRKIELVERSRLDLTTRARAYSRGSHQKVAVVAALAEDTDLLVLDEPTSGPGPVDGGGLPRVHRRTAPRGAAVLVARVRNSWMVGVVGVRASQGGGTTAYRVSSECCQRSEARAMAASNRPRIPCPRR
ncbi:hypothetical protein GCM10023350_30980 [Nocardioides endophyticus]|uniref:ATP-binding cassette domain-containing protein n=1 Tax=Nocardioides endophyticus TaxID=1353775 RepID=A0ABP8Z1V9_9ACTN